MRTFWRRRVCRCAASRIFFFRSSDLRSVLPPEPVASKAGCLAGGSSPGSSAGGQSPSRNEYAKGPRGCSPGWTSPFCNVPSPIRTVPGSRGGIPSGLGRRGIFTGARRRSVTSEREHHREVEKMVSGVCVTHGICSSFSPLTPTRGHTSNFHSAKWLQGADWSTQFTTASDVSLKLSLLTGSKTNGGRVRKGSMPMARNSGSLSSRRNFGRVCRYGDFCVTKIASV